MGVRPDRTASYRKSPDGLGYMFSLVSDVVESAQQDESFDEIFEIFKREEKVRSEEWDNK